MKVIDLLNKIANGEEVPKKIKYGVYYWKYDEENKDYQDNDDDYVFSCSNYDIIDMLNKDVEIIEEPQEPKIPEKFKVHSLGDKDEYGNYVSSPFPTEEEMMNKINEILDYLEGLE